MKYETFRKTVQGFPLFKSSIFLHLTKDVPTLRRQLSDWIKKGYVLTLKRGTYTLREKDRQEYFSIYFLANQLYSPSYISLETALSYYGFIPEGVHLVTSVSTKKTQQYTNNFGKFSYHHIKTAHYHHFLPVTDEFNRVFYIATKEKAIIDYIYLKMRNVKTFNKDYFLEALRMQNLEQLNMAELKRIANMFNNKKINNFTEGLIKYVRSL